MTEQAWGIESIVQQKDNRNLYLVTFKGGFGRYFTGEDLADGSILLNPDDPRDRLRQALEAGNRAMPTEHTSTTVSQQWLDELLEAAEELVQMPQTAEAVSESPTLRQALNLIGFDDARIKSIAESGAYWKDADPLVKACRAVDDDV